MAALPSHTKTWTKTQIHVSPTGVFDDDNRSLLYQIKASLITLGWTVVSSSDSVTADASDNWADSSDVVFNTAGNAHSWIVLQNANIATNFQICIDCSETAATTEQCTMAMSYGDQFSGGTITARPTATDEIVLLNSDYWGPYNGTHNGNFNCTIISSSDNTFYYLLFFNHNQVTRAIQKMWMIGKPVSAPSGWTEQAIGFISPSNDFDISDLEVGLSVATSSLKFEVGGTTVNGKILCYAGDFDNSSTTWAYRSTKVGSQVAAPAEIATLTDDPGIYGRIPDMFLYSARQFVAPSVGYISAQSKRDYFFHRGIIVPNDGTEMKPWSLT